MQAIYKKLYIFLFFGILFGNDIAFIESKPKGIPRDFYIYEYLEGSISPEDAIKLYDLIDNKSAKIINRLKGKIPHSKLPRDLFCKELSFEELIKSDDSCLKMGFKLSYALDKKLDNEILTRLDDKRILNQIKILQSKNILDSMLKASGEDFSDIYFALHHKQDIFNHSSKNIKLMSNKNYNKAIYHMVISQKFPKFTKALLSENITGVNDWTFFALALNELKSGNKNKAKKYFSQTAQVTKRQFLKDRANFWQYKITQNKQFLNEIANSSFFNLYSLYSTTKLGVSPKYDIITIDDPIFSALGDKKSPFDIENPFEWQILRQNIMLVKDKEALLSIAKLFYYKDTLPHLIFVLNRYYDFSKNFFVMPYYDGFDFDTPTKTLLYSVAKQESRFVPSVVSRSYALGMLQIMPFNVEYFAKDMGLENVTKDSMFSPNMALKFGAYYLNHLAKEFKHPLFVSYAYNGGPTFIRNFLKNPAVFSKKNKYDPWLSMEFIPYEESRIYGMKIMANYIIYNKIEGNIIDIDSFLQETLR
ncbi:hypothetical protein CCY99_05670 [Helicobacter sp. 16-1353]|uniref:lytic transglycosylase domain-containing protein n=1 Tax=Helicobacter sp. 16-1353 TaxID=2004996 RepID=UPI000DCC7D11|nr:lytic transglycosylase domain-containing protein [Helicobacter sp. 16-1353]RAX53870.1 hypothetical protein CCY99_05670 [Helicobacter sp. 16-1353]